MLAVPSMGARLSTSAAVALAIAGTGEAFNVQSPLMKGGTPAASCVSLFSAASCVCCAVRERRPFPPRAILRRGTLHAAGRPRPSQILTRCSIMQRRTWPSSRTRPLRPTAPLPSVSLCPAIGSPEPPGAASHTAQATAFYLCAVCEQVWL